MEKKYPMMKKKNRIGWGKEPHICHDDPVGNCYDCGCKEGEIHDYPCDMEECPICHKQFMSCGEECLNKIRDNKGLLMQYNKKNKDFDAYLPSLDYVAPMLSDSKCDDEYVKPFFSCDPHCVKKSKKEGKYILPGGEYCL